MDAMSCGAVVLGSATSPVMEMIVDGQNGLLANFFDVEEIAEKAVKVLRDPSAFRPLGRAAEAMIAERYSLEAVLPKMMAMYEQTVNRRKLSPQFAEPPVENIADIADARVLEKRGGTVDADMIMPVHQPQRSPFMG